MSTDELRALMMAAAAECMDPAQHTLFEAIGWREPDGDVYARLYRCILKRECLAAGAMQWLP